MHDFVRKHNALYCEQMPVAAIVKKYGTPLFIYSRNTIVDHLRKLQTALAPLQPLVCYSLKANSNLSIGRLLANAGAGADIVSGGELFRAQRIGIPGDKIVYASVGKTPDEITAAIKAGILFFNVESVAELEMINAIAGRLRRTQAVAIRVNPDVDAGTHDYITTAKKQNKFGIDFKTAKTVILAADKKLPHVAVKCIHVHIGSQIEHVTPFVKAIRKAVDLIEFLNARGARITHLNIGGGLGIIYKGEKPQTAQEYAAAIMPLLQRTGLRVILEPGRFIVGNAGILATKIIYVKNTAAKRFYIVDAAMNDLVRPSLYDAYHAIEPVMTPEDKGTACADVVGPICESGDFLAKNRRLPRNLRADDVLAVMSAGAYGFSMSSNYNSRPRAAEVMVCGKKCVLIRSRETFADLIRNEIIADI